MRQTAEQVEQRYSETIAALSQFKRGDRVCNPKGELGTFMGVNNGYANPECWIDFDSDLELDLPNSKIGFFSCDPLLLKKIESCSNVSTSLAESEPQVVRQETLEELKPSSTSNGIASAKPCCEKTSHQSQFTETLPLLKRQPITGLICSSVRPLAPLFPPQVDEMEALTIEIYSPNVCESLTNAVPDSSLSKTLPDCCDVPTVLGGQPEVILNGLQENCSDEPFQETSAFLAVPNLDCHTSADDCLLLPTPTGLSSLNSRPPGQMKLESHLKKLGLLVRGQVVNPQFLEMMMKVDLDYTSLSKPGKQVLSLSVSRQKTPLKESDVKPLETVSQFPVSKSPCNGSSTSIALQELTIDEEHDFHYLERKVENAFIKAELVFREAVFALKEIRDRKLYRSSNATFEEYCKERFGFSRRRPYQLIDAAVVLENLANPDLQMCTKTEIGTHLLPTNERQIRDLVDLEPEDQVVVWGKATSSGKIPSGDKIKDTLDAHMRERLNQPPIPTYCEGDVVEIRSGGHSSLREHDGMWGIVTEVNHCRYKVYISLRNMQVRCKGDELEKVKTDAAGMAEIISIGKRASTLLKTSDKLNHAAIAVLDTLGRQTCFSPDDLWLLEQIEQRFQVKND